MLASCTYVSASDQLVRLTFRSQLLFRIPPAHPSCSCDGCPYRVFSVLYSLTPLPLFCAPLPLLVGCHPSPVCAIAPRPAHIGSLISLESSDLLAQRQSSSLWALASLPTNSLFVDLTSVYLPSSDLVYGSTARLAIVSIGPCAAQLPFRCLYLSGSGCCCVRCWLALSWSHFLDAGLLLLLCSL